MGIRLPLIPLMEYTLEGIVAGFEEFDYECPRCQSNVEGKFFGPCDSCVDELKATQKWPHEGWEPPENWEPPKGWVEPEDWPFGKYSASEATGYVPKMNVTPNAVATKE